jgi:hypothetical protein
LDSHAFFTHSNNPRFIACNLANEGPVLEEGCDENFGSVAFGAEALGWASEADVNRAFDSDEAGCFC